MSGQLDDLYDEWKGIENQKKSLNETKSEFVKRYAKSRGVKPGQIEKAFRFRKHMEDKGEDQLEEVVTLFQELDHK